jgi:pimeloyl-ACP methyl ester carboxylesterase
VLATVCATATLCAACTSSDDSTDAARSPSEGTARPGASATTDTPATTTTIAPVLEDAPCPEPGTDPTRVTCSVLVVPEDPARPSERQVELPVLHVRPTADLAAPDTDGAAPVVYLHGGPGGAATPQWGVFLTVTDAIGRDAYLFDQRGGGASTPSLTCPEHDRALLGALSTTDAPTVEQERVGDALAACHARLTDEGVALEQYDLDASVRDLEALRNAIGAPSLTLVATSYGTRLAQRYRELHPRNVAAMALDSVDVVGPDAPGLVTLADEAVERLIDDCAADAACESAHPDLRAALEQAMEDLDRDPATMELAATDATPGATLQVTGDDLYAALFAAMYDTLVIPVIPTVIDQLAAGDRSAVAVATQRVGASLLGTAMGARMSVECARPTPVGSEADGSEADGSEAVGSDGAGRAATLELTAAEPFCDRWPLDDGSDERGADGTAGDDTAGDDGGGHDGDGDADERAVPTLVVAGELDPITPADRATAFAERADAALLLLRRAGHAAMLSERCALRSLRAFLERPADVSSAVCDP